MSNGTYQFWSHIIGYNVKHCGLVESIIITILHFNFMPSNGTNLIGWILHFNQDMLDIVTEHRIKLDTHSKS